MPGKRQPRARALCLVALTITLAALMTVWNVGSTLTVHSASPFESATRSPAAGPPIAKRLFEAVASIAGSPSLIGQSDDSDDRLAASLTEAYGRLPLSFEANRGQVNSHVKFLSRGSGYDLFLTSNEAVLALRRPAAEEQDGQAENDDNDKTEAWADERQQQSAVVRLKLVGSNSRPPVTAEQPLDGRVNYLRGSDPAKWQTDVPTFGRIRYENVYQGVDLIYYGNQRQLEYDFVVSPGSRPEQIKLGFTGAASLRIDENGDLLLGTEAGEVRQYRPVVYQESDGIRQEVAASYVLKGSHEVGFELGEYDPTRPLVIDPVLAYSTLLGGSAYDTGIRIAVDSGGNAYVAGYTASEDFPVVQPVQAQRNLINDAFVTKLNPTGTALVYSTYLGGSDADRGDGIAVDASGSAYIKGHTNSTNFPTTAGSYDTTFNGVTDAFIAKLSPAGNSLVYSTYLGGSDDEDDFGDFREGGITLDSAGDAYVCGFTFSDNFPVVNPLQASRANSTANAYITKLNPQGNALLYSTYFYPAGAANLIHGTDIALDQSGNIYLGSMDGFAAFISKLNAAGTAVIYNNRYAGDDGGSIGAEGISIAVDQSGNAYLTGTTTSFTFPITPNAYQPRKAGNHDIFVLKLNTAGSALIYSTFLGGAKNERSGDIDVDPSGNAYITGHTDGGGGYCSQAFPLVDPLPNSPGAGCSFPDKGVFASKLDPSGNSLLFSTLIGPGNGMGIAVDSAASLYVTGWTNAPAFPTTSGAFQTALAGNYSTDAFVSKISSTATTPQFFIIRGRLVGNQGPVFQATVTLTGSRSTTTLTDADGYYTFRSLPAGGTYTVSPSKSEYTFAPESQTVSNLSSNQTVNFTGTTAQQNAIPSAYLTSPRAFENYSAPANITVSAFAEDSDGAISKVDFYANSTHIGTDATPPYSIVWSNAGPGDYDISVVATDNQGAAGGSGHVPISVQQSLFCVITGRVTNDAGIGFGGVPVTLAGPQNKQTTTDSDGNYSFTGLLAGQSYTVTANRPNYVFTPASLAFNNLSGSQTGTIVAIARSTIRSADFDGDGLTDVSVWQSDSGKWHVLHSADPGATLQFWGRSSLGDVAVPADYDGDGITDIAIFRPSEGNWYILRSTNGAPSVIGWGQQNDRPVPADYDGDGVTDVAVYRPSDGNWYVRQSSGGSMVQGWGNPTDKLLPADYDGDGRADVAVWRPSDGNWYVKKSTGGVVQQNWGIGTDQPVPADYDGDGITDLAVFRPSEGNWYVRKSAGGVTVRNWGASADRPVPGDYDGDGKADLAIWRPSEATWYIIQSRTNTSALRYLGSSADLPLPAANLR